MQFKLPTAGAASSEVQTAAHNDWAEAAAKAGIDLSSFNPGAPLSERLTWAKSQELDLGTILSRFSSKMQHSTAAQVRSYLEFAARSMIYVPPEFICTDEGVSGRKQRRDGLDRVKVILKKRFAEVLLVFKDSRLFRVGYKGFQFFQEEVVEEGLRAISISQGIDTRDAATWKHLAYLHGMMDEMLLGTIADHVRTGIMEIARQGYVTGKLTTGYIAVEVPNAPRTNLGKPRRMPAIDAEIGPLIRQHFEQIRDGMTLKEGWRRWVAATGTRTTYHAYRRTLSNPRYRGYWAFGKKRNVWSSKRDGMRQVEQADTEVITLECPELRIVSDQLFFEVQTKLTAFKSGPRGPKKRASPRLWDLVTDCFLCAACSTDGTPVRFNQAGSKAQGMACKNGALCPNFSVIRREPAILAVLEILQKLLLEDSELIDQIVARAQAVDGSGHEDARRALERVSRQLAKCDNKIADLADLAGEGGEADRKVLKDKIRSALADRAALHLEKARLEQVSATRSRGDSGACSRTAF